MSAELDTHPQDPGAPAPYLTPVQPSPAPGLSREVDVMLDGRRITYYTRADTR